MALIDALMCAGYWSKVRILPVDCLSLFRLLNAPVASDRPEIQRDVQRIKTRMVGQPDVKSLMTGLVHHGQTEAI